MTDKERKAIADIFRRIRPNSRLSLIEARPAVKYLLRLKGFSKTEEDVVRFFGHHFNWFCKKKAVFARASDEEVLRQVRNLFRAYMGYRNKSEAENEEGVLSFSDLDEGRIKCTKPETLDETDYQVARERTEAKGELKPLQRLVRRLKREKDEVSIKVLEYPYRREVDRQNDPALRQEDEWKLKDAINSAIEKAHRKKSTPKK